MLISVLATSLNGFNSGLGHFRGAVFVLQKFWCRHAIIPLSCCVIHLHFSLVRRSFVDLVESRICDIKSSRSWCRKASPKPWYHHYAWLLRQGHASGFFQIKYSPYIEKCPSSPVQCFKALLIQPFIGEFDRHSWYCEQYPLFVLNSLAWTK